MIQLAYAAFLTGAAAIAVPIILHFLRRKPTEEESFPSFMFLGASAQIAQKKNSLRKWLLLILRCLALIFLALAFAWPFIPAFDEKPASATVILWDNSLSMMAAPYSAELKKLALDEISKAGPKDPALVGIVGKRTVWSGKFSSKPEDLKAFFESSSNGLGSSSFKSALALADTRLQSVAAPKRRLIVVTDKQALPWKDLGAEAELSFGTELKVLTPKNPGFRNIAISAVHQATPFISAQTPVSVDVEISNHSKLSIDGKLRLFMGDLEAAKQQVSLKPFEIAQFRMTLRSDKFEATPCRAEFEIKDDLPQDNTRYFALNPGEAPYVLATPSQNKLDFVKMAFQPSEATRAAEFKIFKPTEFSEGALSKASLLLLREGFPANTDAERLLRQYLERGGVACVLWRESQEMRGLLLRYGIKTANAINKKTVQFGELDFDDPIFKRFLETKVGGLFEIRFTGTPIMSVPEEAHVIAAYKDGPPAIFELPVGKGRLMIVATQLDRSSTDWAASPSFLPFWRELLATCRKNTKDSESFELKTGFTTTLKAPDGSAISTDKPCCVKVSVEGHELYASVNTAPEESNPALLPTSFDFAKLVRTTEEPSPAQQKPELKQATLVAEKGTPLWKPFLLIALLLLLSEMILANRTAL